MTKTLELTILMPCLNEAKTLPGCIKQARTFLRTVHATGEVLIADNGSTDNSPTVARQAGARVIAVPTRGYGAALRAGIAAAQGKFIIMGDADASYDFSALEPFLTKLRHGSDLVMGNRFRGTIKKGAMPPLHRYLGNPVLSAIGRLFFGIKIGDFHSGLRGFNRTRIIALDLQTTGMEFASEMVVKASLAHYRLSEVPIVLSPDGRDRPPHLRSWRDGWRHLKFLLLYSPNWLFVYPGLFLLLIGLIFTLFLSVSPLNFGSIIFSVNTLLYSCALILVGANVCLFALFTKLYALQVKYLPQPKSVSFYRALNTEIMIALGLILFLLGLAASLSALLYWRAQAFGKLDPESILRLTIPAATSLTIGSELVFAGFFLDILKLKKS